MQRNAWTTPFGIAFLVGSVAALIAGFFTGSGMRGGELNMTAPSLNMAAEPTIDENALVAANREPPPQAAPPPVAPQPQPAPQAAAPADDSASSDDASAAPVDDQSQPAPPADTPRRRRNAEPPPDEPGDAPPNL